MCSYSLLLIPRRNGITADGGTVDVLMRLQAPDAPAAGRLRRRPSLNVAFVLDRSGSMAGRPLDEAKRCIEQMIDGLQPPDRVALVAYDADVSVLMPSCPVANNRGVYRDLLASVRAGSTTNLHGGWLEGARQLPGQPADDELARLILLSDGMANVGLTDPESIAAQCQELAGAGVTTSTYGLGRGFNEALMIAMAEAGGGNHYYGETAADLIDPFRAEFELLEDLCARHVRLRLAPAPGVQVDVLNGYPAAGRETWRLPDLAYGSEGWAVLRLNVPEGAAGPDQSHLPAMDLEVELVDVESRERRFLGGTLVLPAVSKRALEALPEDALVASRVRELELADLQTRIRDALGTGDWPEAQQLLGQAERLAEDHPWLEQAVRSLRQLADEQDGERLMKEAAFSASRKRRRLTGKQEDSGVFDPAAEAARPAYLRRKRREGRADDTDR